MPGLANVGNMGINTSSILPNGQIPITAPNLTSGQPAYTASSQRQFGNIDFQHIADSQMLQGVGAFFREKNQAADFKRYNRTQSNPLLQIPQNPNTSQQSLYGAQGFKSGGLTSGKAKEMLRDGTANGKKLTAQQKRYFGYIAGGGKPKMAIGGDPTGGPEINTQNMIKADLSGRRDAQHVDLINSVLSGRNSSIYGYGDTQDKLMMQAYLWRKQNVGQSPEQLIQGFYGKPVANDNPIDIERRNLSSIGYGPNAMYNDTPNMGVRAFADGGPTDIDPDEFDNEDFEDLKDELDRYFKDKGNASAPKEESDEKEPEQQEGATEQPMENSRRGQALDFLMQNDDEDYDKEDFDDINNSDNGGGSAYPYVKGQPIDLRTPLNKPGGGNFSSGINGSMMPDMSNHPLLQSFNNGIAKVENAAYSEGI